MRRNVPTWFQVNLDTIAECVRRDGVDGLKNNSFSEILYRGNEEGSLVSKYLLGLLYDYLSEKRLGIERWQGVALIVEAAELGYQDAITWCTERVLSFFLDEDQNYQPFILNMCRAAAEKGNAKAQFMLSMLLMGWRSIVTPNPERSEYWLNKAYEQGFDPTTWMESLIRRRR